MLEAIPQKFIEAAIIISIFAVLWLLGWGINGPHGNLRSRSLIFLTTLLKSLNDKIDPQEEIQDLTEV